jgi:hypothetical protein
MSSMTLNEIISEERADGLVEARDHLSDLSARI